MSWLWLSDIAITQELTSLTLIVNTILSSLPTPQTRLLVLLTIQRVKRADSQDQDWIEGLPGA